ncbi:MAG: dTDP-4-dehydrorhamnose 3,5-epimerase [Desulforhopalus sp.]
MKILDTKIPDVKIIEPAVFGDERGFFMETFQERKMAEAGIRAKFVQDNHSSSGQGILRGLHFQKNQTQGKLVRVIRGEVFDVAVDLRKDSNTFGEWVGVTLSAKNKIILWVPEGFAHGFYVTSKQAEFVYKCTNYYAPEHECSLLWNDPDLSIKWPLVNGMPPNLSQKDRAALPLKETGYFINDKFVEYKN